MKKEEKTKITYERILIAAINEFGTNGYDKASLTAICNDNKIAKGLLYHNFKSKDELYLKCVETCLDKMIGVTSSINYTDCDIKANINLFLSKRQQFFRENTNYANIFFNVVLNPPAHLKNEIYKIKEDFDIFSKECYKKLFANVSFNDGITLDLAVEYFVSFQEMFNAYFQRQNINKDNFDKVIVEHELSLSKFLDIILYGIIEKEK